MAAAGNHLIDRLPRTDKARLLRQCDAVALRVGDVMGEPGQVPGHIYFPVDGCISLLALDQGRAVLEVGMVGREGMLGLHWVLGVASSPLRALVQGAGSSWRIPSAALRQALAASPALQAVLLRYAQLGLAQAATAALCLRFHEIGPRLARWLLMTEDRASSPLIQATQAALASRLGVRRVGVTAAAGNLQARGLIAYRRGTLQVLNRPALLAAACSCYAADQRTYAAVMG